MLLLMMMMLLLLLMMHSDTDATLKNMLIYQVMGQIISGEGADGRRASSKGAEHWVWRGAPIE